MKKISSFLLPLMIALILSMGCTNKDSVVNPTDTGGGTLIIVQVQQTGKLQDDNDKLLSTLLQKTDKTSALDSLVKVISKDTSVSSCFANTQGIAIQYKNGIKGGILLDPEDTTGGISPPSIPANYLPLNNLQKTEIIPSSKKTIFINPHYKDRVAYADPVMNLYNTIFPRVGFNQPVIYLDTNATIDVFSSLAGYGIVHIYSHGWAWPNKQSISEVYLMTGENINETTTKKYSNEITGGIIPLVKLHNGAQKYFISPDFFASKNDFEKDSTIVYGGFCFGFLGGWPDRLINKSKALAYTGFTWRVLTNWNTWWARSLFDSLSNKNYKDPMDIEHWFASTPTVAKQYFDNPDKVTCKIQYTGRANLTLWGKIKIDSLSPNTGKVNDVITIYGQGFGTVPGTISFNGTNAVSTSWSEKKIITTVPEGTTSGYVTVKIGSDESNKVLFTLASNIIDILHKCTSVDATLYGDLLNTSGEIFGSMISMASNEKLSNEIPLVWSGTSFTANGTYKDAVFWGAKSGSRKLTFTGTVSADGKTLLNFSAEENASYVFMDNSTYEENIKLAGNNIPLESFLSNPPAYANGVFYKKKGPGAQALLNVISGNKVSKDKTGQVTSQSIYSSINWNNTQDVPYIMISFSDYW